MFKSLKFLSLLFIAVLLTTVGLSVYYLQLQKGLFNKPITAIKGQLGIILKDRTRFVSEVSGISVEITEEEKLSRALEQMKIWELGVPVSTVFPSTSKPRQITYILVDEIQPREISGRDGWGDKVISSIGYSYDKDTGEFEIKLYYDEEYLRTTPIEELEYDITYYVLEYSLRLSGDKIDMVAYPKHYPEIVEFIEEFLQPNDSWFKIKRS